MNKEDLRELISEEGTIITLRNGDRLVKTSYDNLTDLDDDCYNPIVSTEDFNEDLKCLHDESHYCDIMKIEKPLEYKTVYIRGDEDKEATDYDKLLHLVRTIKRDLDKTLICNRHFKRFNEEYINIDIDHINYLISMIEDTIN